MNVRETAAGNGARLDTGRSDALRLEPPATAGRRRLPELMLGIFLVAGCALGAVLLAQSGRERTPVLALATDVSRGQVVGDADLKTVYVGADSHIAYLGSKHKDEVIGRAALTDLAAGTLVTGDQFAPEPQVLASGDGAVGLALEAPEMPSVGLVPGDLVTVVAQSGDGAAQVAADAAQVIAVQKLNDSGGQPERWWVTLRSTENDAVSLAEATAGDQPVQVVLVRR
jgi:hypothetical protein